MLRGRRSRTAWVLKEREKIPWWSVVVQYLKFLESVRLVGHKNNNGCFRGGLCFVAVLWHLQLCLAHLVLGFLKLCISFSLLFYTLQIKFKRINEFSQEDPLA